MSSVAGFPHGGSGGRASMMRAGGTAQRAGPAPPQPTAAELAAAAARRQKAEQRRALAQLPGLVHRLRAAEKAVLLNLQHSQLARYHCVRYCSSITQEPGDVGYGGAEEAAVALLPPGGQRCATHRRSAGPSAVAAPADMEAENAQPAALTAAAAAATEAVGASEPPTPEAALSEGPPPMLTGRQLPQPELQLLWSWQSELSEDLPVSCLAFNKAAPGLVAVGYGRLEYAVSGVGLVAVWSLANPCHPLWHAATPCGVSALDWSSRSADTLAVGFFDGSLALYDVRTGASSSNATPGAAVSSSTSSNSRSPKPLARAPPACASGGSGAGHAEPVWRLRFVPKPSDPADEMLVSISSDGRLLEWKHAQGLECAELLRLKRQQGGAAAPRLQGSARQTQVRFPAAGWQGPAGPGTDVRPAERISAHQH